MMFLDEVADDEETGAPEDTDMAGDDAAEPAEDAEEADDVEAE